MLHPVMFAYWLGPQFRDAGMTVILRQLLSFWAGSVERYLPAHKYRLLG